MSWFGRPAERSASDVAFAELARVQAETITRLEQDNRELRTLLLEKDRHYAALVERLTAPQLMPTKVVLPSSPEGQAMTGAKDAYVERMVTDFVNHAGMSPEMARQEAERLAREAENRMY